MSLTALLQPWPWFPGSRRGVAAVVALAFVGLGVADVISRRTLSRPITLAAADFELGATDGESDEKPPHRVHVGGFAIDRHEVTLGEYAECVAQKRCTAAGVFHEWCVAKGGAEPSVPVNCVSYSQSVAYCSFRGGRLPTEQEWEYAARGRDQRQYPWGTSAPTDRSCWQKKRPCSVRTSAEDRSPFGLWDMAGNVSEWTSSAYCDYADPKRCKPGVRVTRGGSFDLSDPRFLRTTYRDWVREADAGYNLSMRCAFDVAR